MRVTPLSAVPLLLSALVGCGPGAEPAVVADVNRAVSSAAPLAPPDDARTRSAQQALQAFLDASRESSQDRAAVDSLVACGDDGQSFFPTTLLAGYTLLPFELRGDTIVGRAEVVTVAEQDLDRRATDRFVARERIRTDVLEWDVLSVDADHWVVCNGLRFGYRGVDSLTTWRPEGASYATARRLADSIAAVSR